MGSGTLKVIQDSVAAATAGFVPLETSALPPELPAGITQQLAEEAFGRAQWQEAFGWYVSALTSGEAVVDIGRCLLFAARCALHLTEFRTALHLLDGYTEAFPSDAEGFFYLGRVYHCLLYTSPSPRDRQKSRMPSSA